MWLNLRGPKLICSPIRDITFYRGKDTSSITPKFILSNVGGSSAVIEYIAIELLRISPDKEEYRFISGFEGSFLDQEKKGIQKITNLDNPVPQFVIEKGKAEVKEITFMHAPEFDYIRGEYKLKLLIMQQNCHGFWTRFLSKFTERNGRKEITVLEQKVHTIVGLSYMGDGRRK